MIRIPTALFGCLTAVLVANSAWACCASEPSFAEVVRTAPVVVRARVTALSQGDGEATPDAPAVYVDLEVLAVKRGQGIASTMRVWDAYRYSCMSGGLDGLRVGERVVLAAHPVSELNAESAAVRASGSLRRAAEELPHGDFFIRGCGRYWKARQSSEHRR